MFVDFVFKCFEVVEIFGNPYFGMEYGLVFSLCLLPYLAAILLLFVYICNDTPFTRSVVPWAFLAAAIASILIAIWVIVYICGIYKEPMVRKPLNWGDEAEDMDSGNYTVQKKASYVFWNTVLCFINFGLFLWAFFAY